MTLEQILSWVVGAVGITGFFLAGKRVWWAWYVNIGCQAIWVAFAIVSNNYAFLITAFFYTIVFSKNAWNWTMDHLVTKKLLEVDEEIRRKEKYDADVSEQIIRAQRSGLYGRQRERSESIEVDLE
jgi:hypothetical protein